MRKRIAFSIISGAIVIGLCEYILTLGLPIYFDIIASVLWVLGVMFICVGLCMILLDYLESL